MFNKQKMCYKFSKIPMIQVQEPVLRNISEDLEKLLAVKRRKRKMVFDFICESSAIARRKSGKRVSDEYPITIFRPITAHDFRKFSKEPQNTEMSRFQEKKIRRSIQARGLEETFSECVDEYIEEVKHEYNKIIHYAAMNLKIKSCHPEVKCVVLPYKFFGKTERYNEFLAIRKMFGKRWILHNPIIRKVHNECVIHLPSTLFKLRFKHVFKISEIKNEFEEKSEKANQIAYEFYRKILQITENEGKTNKKVDIYHYLKVVTGLLTLHISQSVMRTIRDIVDFTAAKEPKPYIFLEITFFSEMVLEPTPEELEDTYHSFIDYILEIRKEIYDLQSYKMRGLKSKNVNLNITDEFIINSKNEITSNINLQFEPILDYLKGIDSGIFTVYKDLDSDEFLESIVDMVFEEGCKKINFYREYLNKVMFIPDFEFFRIAKVSFVKYKRQLHEALNKNIDLVFEKLAYQHFWEVNDLCETFEHIKMRATRTPETTEELVETGKFINYIKNEHLLVLEERVGESLLALCKIIDIGLITKDHMDLNCMSIQWLTDIVPIIEQHSVTFDTLKYDAEEKLQKVVEDVGEMIKKVFPLLALLDEMDNIANVKKYLNFIILHMKKIKEVEKQIEWINQEESTLSFPNSTYPEYEELKDYVYPFHHLLHLCLEVRQKVSSWQDGPFENLNYDLTKNSAEEFHKELTESYKVYRLQLRQAQDQNIAIRFKGTVDDPDILNWPAPLKLCGTALKLIEDFKPAVEVMKIVCNRCLMERHWQAMSEVAGVDVMPNAGTTLRKIMQVDFFSKMEEYEIISVGATKEQNLLDQLNRLQEEWDNVQFSVSSHKYYDMRILIHLDEIESVITDQSTIIFDMRGSVFVKPYEKEVKEFQKIITKISKTIIFWYKIQNILIKLYPIISLEELNHIIPRETELLRSIIDKYNGFIDLILKDAKVIKIISESSLTNDLENCMNDLEIVFQGINFYLDGIRASFPRFYFISNDEFIKAISNSKAILVSEFFLNKLFQGIQRLDIKDNEVVGIVSKHSEVLKFPNPISIESTLEKTFIKVEQVIKATLKNEILNCSQQYSNTDFVELFHKYCEQTLKVVSHCFWTENIDMALCLNSEVNLKIQLQNLESSIKEKIHLMKIDLNNFQKLKIKNIIINEIYIKNVVKQIFDAKIFTIDSFEWEAHFKYYLKNGSLKISMMNSTINFMYEYSGNFQYIITPNTERYLRMLINTYYMNYNGFIVGPSDSGKFECVKMLAAIFGNFILKFTCNKELSTVIFERILRGSLLCGSWLYFENFTDLKLTVMSAISEYLFNIQAARKENSHHCLIGGVSINFKPSYFLSICKTKDSNTDIPISLKRFFRITTMLKADKEQIAETVLYSQGFTAATVLAKKVSYVIDYLDDILSKKYNYSRGMSKFMKVLQECEKLSLETKNSSELDLIFSAITKVLGQGIPIDAFPDFHCVLHHAFPDATLIQDSISLEKITETICNEEKLQWNKNFSLKISELYQTIKNDRSVLLVGNTNSSKTTMVKICKKIFEILDGKLLNLHFLTPNSFTPKSLYGHLSDSDEWIDGVVTKLCRLNETEASPTLIVFDGDINSSWIEGIKLIIKEKRLYLESGEILKLDPSYKILFEVDNLDNCSPTVISHSTVIYVYEKTMDWSAKVSTWITTCNADWIQGYQRQIGDILCWIMRASLDFFDKSCKQICSLSPINLVNNMITLTKLLLDDACKENKKDEELKNLYTWIQASIIQAGILGLAGVLDLPSRHKFDEFYRQLWRGQNPLHPYPKYFGKLDVGIPQEGLLIDYQYIYKQRGNWKLYQDLLKLEKIIENPNMKDILIPTIDTFRYSHILNLYIKDNLPVVLVGPTCTGKSILIESILRTKLEEKKYDISHVNFNVYFDAEKAQQTILSKLNKRKAGIYSPSTGKDFLLFIDNLNQGSSDKYGNHGCTELLRQHLDHKVWYDFTSVNEVFVSNLNIISAMGVQQGSNKALSLRFLRHFHIFGFNEFSEETITKIYSNVLTHFWRQNGFPSDTTTVINQIVEGTYFVYKNIVNKFRPTLKRPYFCFNLNSFSNVIRGCSLLKKETYEANKKICLKLWIHENMSVFGDRLDKQDNLILENVLKEAISTHFNESTEDIETPLNKIILSTINDRSNGCMKYEEVDQKNVLDILNEELTKYNYSHKIKINVVFFEYALEKIYKICRVFSLKSGNAIFLGSSGLGRISLTKLVSYIYGYTLFQPTITREYTIENWKCELKKVLREAGAIEHRTVFLINERELLNEEYLQYVERLLQSGDIYDVFNAEEKQEILELSRLSAQGGNRNLDISSASVFLHFGACYKINLHLLMCLSTNPKRLRSRMRNFPSLMNCHIIFWDDWPDEALQNVAEIRLTDMSLDSEERTKSIDTFIYFHRQFESISKSTINELCARIFISPICFLHLIELFTELYTNEKSYIGNKINNFSQGLAKLSYAANQILDMERVLADYKPQLAEMTAKAIEMTEQIALETIQIEKASELVRQDEQIACQQAIVAQNLKSECEAELAQAIPILEDAISALNTLKPSDITLVKSMKNPPDAIKLVMAAVCVIKDVKPDRIPDPSTGRKTFDFWGPSKRILGDMNFLQTLKDFDKDNIKSEIMVKIRKEFLPHKDFKPHTVAKASSAAEGLCKWIIAMDMYDKVAKEVAPKKEKLGNAEKEYSETMEILNQKKEEVKRIEEKLAALNALLEDANKRQLKLQKEVDLCNRKLVSAQKLIGSLSEEQVRWTKAVKKLEKQNELASGNILLTSGIVAYLAPLDYNTRNNITKKWRQHISNYLRCSHHFNMDQSYSSKIKIDVKKRAELLRDDFFLQNILIYDFSKLYSIFVDPDYQANDWIRKSEQGNNLTITTLCHADFLIKLKNCIIFGKPILIHKIKGNIPSCLYHFISKHYYNENGDTFISIDNETIKLSANFRIYLVCNVAKPIFSPEIVNKLTVVNFTISPNYLSKHLLQILTEFEKPELKKNKKEIYARKNKYQSEITSTENYILKTLCESQADILEDEESIRILEKYKDILKNLRNNFENSEKDEQTIFNFTDQYKDVANYATNIYFLVCKLKFIKYIYQFSFEWFIYLYYQSILNAEKSKLILVRCEKVIQNFTFELHKKINCSLFQEDKFTFVFLLTLFVLKHKEVITNEEINCFTSSFSSLKITTWENLILLEQLPIFYNFTSSYRNNFISWKEYLKDESCTDIPEPWFSRLNHFQKLILIKMFKPAQLYFHLKNLVLNELGPKFMTNILYNFNEILNESYSLSPIILLSTRDSNFLDELYVLINKKQLFNTFRSVCLGERSYCLNDSLLEKAQDKGYWLLYQNCHLDKTWMKNMEKKLEEMDYENTNDNFRLWLTSKPSDNIPISILQNSIKVVFDHAGSLKQNLQKYLHQEFILDYFCNGCSGRKEAFSKLLFGLISFHSCLIQKSYYYDSILWNCPYALDENDIKVSATIVKTSLAKSKVSCTDIKKISHLIAKYHYGSQIDNSNDLEFINTFLSDFMNIDIAKNRSYCFDDLKEYSLPLKCDYPDYLKAINQYPDNDNIEIFAINKQLDIMRGVDLSNELIDTLSNLFNVNSQRFIEDNEIYLISIVDDILKSLPKKLDLESQKDHILKHEFNRYNILLGTILKSLTVLKNSLNGLVCMSSETEIIAMDMFNSQVPKEWEKLIYSANESLTQFIKSLIKKVNYLKTFHTGQKDIWLAAFSLPKAMFCKIKLDLSLVNDIALENFGFSTEVLSNDLVKDINKRDGIKLSGIFIANAQWNEERRTFCEVSSEIYNAFPSILLNPINISDYQSNQLFELPLYQTCDLNSFICIVSLASITMRKHWIKRDVKLFCHVSNRVSKYDVNKTFKSPVPYTTQT